MDPPDMYVGMYVDMYVPWSVVSYASVQKLQTMCAWRVQLLK